MRKYEKRDAVKSDRSLIDLHDQRDQLSIQISILRDGDVVDPAILATMQRDLGFLDARISRYQTPSGA
jgi:hypothetical protein